MKPETKEMPHPKTERRTEALKMLEDFSQSPAKVARVKSAKTANPYSVFITIRRNIYKMGLQDTIAVHVKDGNCYITKDGPR